MGIERNTLVVGDLVRYGHDESKVGIVKSFNNQRTDCVLVVWQQPSGGKRQWYVEPSWIEMKSNDGDEWVSCR